MPKQEANQPDAEGDSKQEQALTILERLCESIATDVDVIASMSIEDVDQELREMGIKPDRTFPGKVIRALQRGAEPSSADDPPAAPENERRKNFSVINGRGLTPAFLPLNIKPGRDNSVMPSYAQVSEQIIGRFCMGSESFPIRPTLNHPTLLQVEGLALPDLLDYFINGRDVPANRAIRIERPIGNIDVSYSDFFSDGRGNSDVNLEGKREEIRRIRLNIQPVDPGSDGNANPPEQVRILRCQVGGKPTLDFFSDESGSVFLRIYDSQRGPLENQPIDLLSSREFGRATKNPYDRWIRSQSIGLMAHLLHALHPVFDLEPFAATHELLSQYVIRDPEQFFKTRPAFFYNLPPSVLNILLRAVEQKKAGKRLNATVPDIRGALQRLAQDNPQSFQRAQLWAYHVLEAGTGLDRLIQVGKRLFGSEWKRAEWDKKTIEQLSLCCSALRNPRALTADKRVAIHHLAMLLPKTECWAQIENILFSYQFSWPLLSVTRKKTAPHTTLFHAPLPSIRLPLAVDVIFDSQSQVRVMGNSTNLLVGRWGQRVRAAAYKAKQLWHDKYGDHDSFSKDVFLASVVIDFGFANKIVGDIAACGFERISDGLGYADAYISQAILSKFLGHPRALASAVIGPLDEALWERRDESGDAQDEVDRLAPDLLRGRLDYALSNTDYDKIIVPSVWEPVAREAASHLTDLPVRPILCPENSAAISDAAQGPVWSDQRYVRCPDINWVFRREGKPDLLPFDSPQVKQLLDAVSNNETSPILCLPEVSAYALCGALRHLNERALATAQRRTFLSCAFIRAVENETDVQFWRLAFEAMRATPQRTEELVRCLEHKEVVETVKGVFNGSGSASENPAHRSPDVLVILGSAHLERSMVATRNLNSRPFAVMRVLNELKARASLKSRFKDLLGSTRIILVWDDTFVKSNTIAALRHLETDEQAYLRSLAIFQWGITEQIASTLENEFPKAKWKSRHNQFITSLAEKGLVRRVGEKYHVPHNIRDKVLSQEPLPRLVQRHYAAGCALAPFAGDAKYYSQDLRASFSLENLSEAEAHFREALKLCEDSVKQDLKNQIKNALLTTYLYTGIPTWQLVKSYLNLRGPSWPAFETATQLLEREKAEEVAHHPAHLVLAARAIAKHKKENQDNRHKEEDTLKFNVEDCYRRALNNCSLFPDEEDYNRLLVLIPYALYVLKHQPDRQEEVPHLSGQARRLLEGLRDTSGVPRSWFEMLGDCHPDHAEALSFYRRAIDPSKWTTGGIKALGAASLARESELAKSLLGDNNVRERAAIFSSLKASNQSLKNSPIIHVRERWIEGFNLLNKVHTGSPGQDFTPQSRLQAG